MLRVFVATVCLVAVLRPATAQQQRPVTAETGGIAIGGNVINSTIHDSPEEIAQIVRLRTRPLEFLTETQRQLITRLQTDLDLNQRQIHAALEIVGEANVPPERLAAKLVEFAERFKALQASASTQPGDDPKVMALKIDAEKAIDAGQLGKADALLGEAETEERRAFDRLALNVVIPLLGAATSRSPDCGMLKPLGTLPMRPPRSPRVALTRTNGSAISKWRLTLFTDRGMHMVTTMLCE
jgi:hypothetical protein